MGLCIHIIFVAFALTVALIYSQYHILSRPLKAPKINIDEYWGRGTPSETQGKQAPELQQVVYPEETIDKLRSYLNESFEFHDALEGTTFEYGMNSKYLREFIAYWRDDYLLRWHERQHFLNTLPHYLIKVQGLNIHYIHTKATYDIKGKAVVPLLLLHGWPGSVREFYEIIPKLAIPSDDLDVVFEVVAPSLPGYGWSQGSAKPGFGVVEMAVVLRNVMLRLGYDKFYIQGGDWGSAIGSHIAALFPENVLGYHSNMCFVDTNLAMIKTIIAGFYPSLFIDKKYENFVFPLSEHFSNLMQESGYLHIQATKPDTIGIALSTNPVGLAAYILEKFSTWTNKNYRSLENGGLDRDDYANDAVLDNIMIYYLTNSITTSVRLYSESFSKKHRAYEIDRVPVTVPSGCARFKHDLGHSVDWVLKDKYANMIHSTYHEIGGHFAAMELPDILYADFAAFVRKVRSIE